MLCSSFQNMSWETWVTRIHGVRPWKPTNNFPWYPLWLGHFSVLHWIRSHAIRELLPNPSSWRLWHLYSKGSNCFNLTGTILVRTETSFLKFGPICQFSDPEIMFLLQLCCNSDKFLSYLAVNYLDRFLSCQEKLVKTETWKHFFLAFDNEICI